MRALDGIKGIGKATLAKLAQLGIYTVEELLFFLPSKYVDLKSPVAVLDAEPGQLSLFEGEVTSVSAPSKRGAKAFSVSFRDTLSDKQTRFKATFFNQPYFHDSFYEGGIYRILGKTAIGEATLVNPVFEPADKIRRLDGVMTVYPLKGLIGQTTFAKLVGECIAEFRAEKGENGNFFADVLSKAHFPSTYEEAETAVSALASYDVATAIKIYKNAVSRGDNERKVFYNLQKNIILSFENALSVTPTPSQKRAFEEILADLTSPLDMSRIVSGDVGSGKTLVAFFACVAVASAGGQCAVMAPTELLARQHYEKFVPLAKAFGIEAALLTSSTPVAEANKIRNSLADGKTRVAFGTQSLLSHRISFRSLTLAVIDEQHKFGVNERAELQNKGASDVLTLTATPIPRSLALAFYDDISISAIRKREDAKTCVKTSVVSDSKLEEMLSYTVNECKRGRKAFVVCPSIRDYEGFETLSVNGFTEQYSNILSEVPFGVLHGRLSSEEKNAIMDAFSGGKIRLLVATSVVEVGIDTDATIMCVLAADRFGLASLHQLRGRIGRKGEPSQCFLHVKNTTPRALARLKVLTECTDGALIAERDFELRGAGDVLGTRQSGETLTPCLGLPLTPSVLRAAKHLPQREEAFVTELFRDEFAPDVFAAFTEKICGLTLNS